MVQTTEFHKSKGLIRPIVTDFNTKNIIDQLPYSTDLTPRDFFQFCEAKIAAS